MKKFTYICFAGLFIYLLQPKGGTVFYLGEVRWLYIFLLSFSGTVLFTPVFYALGKKFNMFDYPSERKIHKYPIPVTGGLAVAAAYFVTLLRNLNFSREVYGVLVGGAIIFLSGLIDDLKPIPAGAKLVIQLIATTVLVVFGIRVKVFPNSWVLKDILDITVTYIGVVGITNAFNYMDGMDGEAPGLGLISSVTLFIIAMANGMRNISWLAIGLAGSCAGFLPYNFPRAKIFLGDNGATIIGFLLASIAIAVSWGAHNTPVAIATPLLIFSIYIFDMVYTTISRIKNGTVKNLKQWLKVTGKDHLHHRLVNLGFTKAESVIFIWVCAAVFSFSAYTIRNAGTINALLIFTQTIFIYFLIVTLMLAGREITYDG
ncbi:MAG: MraY family glycosyltransferase [Elusimicrobia bacterium]|jgi:UDP-GlcNAc:undecaprenyl-phosphate GlcNAc-1-phosphate transferase|nr:MraY family glycosyltransferase [Elusimicrobiota bacterium]